MLSSCVARATYIPEEWLLCFALLHSKSNAHHSICFNHVEGYSLVFCFVWVGPLVYICSIAPYAICLLLLCKNKWLKELIILAIDLMLYFLSLLYARMGVQVVSLIFCLTLFSLLYYHWFLIISCAFMSMRFFFSDRYIYLVYAVGVYLGSNCWEMHDFGRHMYLYMHPSWNLTWADWLLMTMRRLRGWTVNLIWRLFYNGGNMLLFVLNTSSMRIILWILAANIKWKKLVEWCMICARGS